MSSCQLTENFVNMFQGAFSTLKIELCSLAYLVIAMKYFFDEVARKYLNGDQVTTIEFHLQLPDFLF